MEHVGTPYPLYEQPKDEIMFSWHCNAITCVPNSWKNFAGKRNTCVTTVTDKNK